MNRFGLVAASTAMLFVSACDGSIFSSGPQCDSDEALAAIDETLKEELQFAVDEELSGQDDYDADRLENAVDRIDFSVDDMRSEQSGSGGRLTCRATLNIDLPKQVESRANEALSVRDNGSVRKVASRYKLKRRSGNYAADFEYSVEQTDDGAKVVVDVEDDADALEFMGEVMGSYLLSGKIRAEQIKIDREKAERERAKRKREQEYEEAGAQALKAAKSRRELASNEIGGVWNNMPKAAQTSIERQHNVWIQQMKAKCADEAVNSDPRASMREANELNCQTRYVKNCANWLRGNLRKFGRWNYCEVR